MVKNETLEFNLILKELLSSCGHRPPSYCGLAGRISGNANVLSSNPAGVKLVFYDKVTMKKNDA